MKLGELTNLYVEAKTRLERERPAKKQKAVEGIPLSQELIRDGGIIAFLFAALFSLIAIVPPPLHEAYDVTQPPTFVKPDWYLLWSLGPIFLAKWPIAIGDTVIIDTSFLGTILVNVAFVALLVIPFIAGRGNNRRPIEAPTNVAWGVFGLAFIWWMSIVAIADIIFAFEVQPLHGTFRWGMESGVIPTTSELIDILGILTLHQSILCALLAYWALKRHRPQYESKLNATYYKVR
jgi:hypothetical protein